ncbi:MAG: hypothetical protein JXN60_05115 [Lentisphaerae bacterium]|nr:hypothetical protein [Lentisphaerota bacterium]
MANELHLRLAKELVSETHAAGGMAPVDIEQFWADQEIAMTDPFGAHIPQVPLGAVLTSECVFAELGIPQDTWRYLNDHDWRLELNKAYNDKSEKIVGRRILNETPFNSSRVYPERKTLADLFEAKNVWRDQSWWLEQSAHGESELNALLDRVERRLERPRDFFLPPEWESEKESLMALGIKPRLYGWQRGPVTFATSIYGTEEFLFLVLDNPTLAARLRDAILHGMLAIAQLAYEEAGYTQENAPHGFGFADDNCSLMTPAMYEDFGYPILKGMFDFCSPNPGDRRYQHSDSAMAHVLPILGKLNLTGTNFGPTVSVAEIRRYLPNAVIDGELAPFTYSRNDEVGIVTEFLRDFSQTREQRGLRFTTAGSVNDGTLLTSMRLVMAAIQRYGRYN